MGTTPKVKAVSEAPGKLDAGLELPGLCDVCRRFKNRGNHEACSRVRQQLYAKDKKNG